MLVVERALRELTATGADAVVLTGDMNTFEDRKGACYAALQAAAAGRLRDVRDVALVEVRGAR